MGVRPPSRLYGLFPIQKKMIRQAFVMIGLRLPATFSLGFGSRYSPGKGPQVVVRLRTNRYLKDPSMILLRSEVLKKTAQQLEARPEGLFETNGSSRMVDAGALELY